MSVFAAFSVVVLPNGRIAGTTRPGGGVGLPGGKVEPGENPVRAAVREAAEEGWDVGGFIHAVNDKLVDGKLVMWFAFERAERRAEWKEKGRVEPVELTLDELANSGMGNDMVARKIKRANEMLPLLRAAARAVGKNFDDAKLVLAGAAGAWPNVDLPDDDPMEMYRYVADAMHRIGVIVYGSIPHAYTKRDAFVEWAETARKEAA
jgi:ADP-ribose pyrophosphatase YjhB (NUDIX family)